MISAPSFYRSLGLAGGSLWLVFVGVVYADWPLVVIRSSIATSALALLSVTALALFAFGVHLFCMVRRLPHGPVEDPSRRRRMGQQFGMIFAAEGIGCAGVSKLCSHHWKLIPPLIIVVVGLHFLALARLFRVPRYYLLGAVFCIIPIATLLSVSSSAHIGHAITWIAIPAIACGLAAIVTACASLAEVHRFLNSSRALSPVRA